MPSNSVQGRSKRCICCGRAATCQGKHGRQTTRSHGWAGHKKLKLISKQARWAIFRLFCRKGLLIGKALFQGRNAPRAQVVASRRLLLDHAQETQATASQQGTEEAAASLFSPLRRLLHTTSPTGTTVVSTLRTCTPVRRWNDVRIQQLLQAAGLCGRCLCKPNGALHARWPRPCLWHNCEAWGQEVSFSNVAPMQGATMPRDGATLGYHCRRRLQSSRFSCGGVLA